MIVLTYFKSLNICQSKYVCLKVMTLKTLKINITSVFKPLLSTEVKIKVFVIVRVSFKYVNALVCFIHN